jgi:CRP-like cAMP-binding protein
MKMENPQLWERVDVCRGQFLCQAGDRSSSLYLIRAGRVEVREPQGHRVLGPGEFFGELDFASESTLPLTVRALETSSLLRIDGQGLKQQLRRRCGGKALHLKKLLGCGDQLIFLC